MAPIAHLRSRLWINNPYKANVEPEFHRLWGVLRHGSDETALSVPHSLQARKNPGGLLAWVVSLIALQVKWQSASLFRRSVVSFVASTRLKSVRGIFLLQARLQPLFQPLEQLVRGSQSTGFGFPQHHLLLVQALHHLRTRLLLEQM